MFDLVCLSLLVIFLLFLCYSYFSFWRFSLWYFCFKLLFFSWNLLWTSSFHHPLHSLAVQFPIVHPQTNATLDKNHPYAHFFPHCSRYCMTIDSRLTPRLSGMLMKKGCLVPSPIYFLLPASHWAIITLLWYLYWREKSASNSVFLAPSSSTWKVRKWNVSGANFGLRLLVFVCLVLWMLKWGFLGLSFWLFLFLAGDFVGLFDKYRIVNNIHVCIIGDKYLELNFSDIESFKLKAPKKINQNSFFKCIYS